MSEVKPITVAHGDGIGPEIMDAVLRILKEAEAPIRIESIELGEKLYKRHYTSGIADDTWDVIERTKTILKAPITTPQGGGYKSLNVTLRKRLGLYANVRPSIAYAPYVSTLHPDMNLVIVRENEEDLYAGIEYRQTKNMYSSLKLISDIGSEKIIRYAFEYAVKNNRERVTCFSKDNIMKFSDGVFHKVFDRVAEEYPSIDSNHFIVDIGTAKLANHPEIFDVIVTSNLYGDIISDVASEISGSVGMAGSANIGEKYAMFEAVHGSAPDIAGKDMANPSGLLNAAVMMMVHLGEASIASVIENAWKKTLEDGIHTSDIYHEDHSAKNVGTKEFADSIIKNLGSKPETLPIAEYKIEESDSKAPKEYSIEAVSCESKILVGVDVFFDIDEKSPKKIAEQIQQITEGKLELKTLSSKGLKLWPANADIETVSDHYCARFMARNEDLDISHIDITGLLEIFVKAKMDFIKTENLYDFSGNRGYSLAQGE